MTTNFCSTSDARRDVLDDILTTQLIVAWSGEGQTDPPRLGWWRTSMVDEYGGQDLFQRLLPHTWRWAVLEAVRKAAQVVDARARETTSDGDQLVSLFRLGFVLDEQLEDRLAELKRAGEDPMAALPGLSMLSRDWDKPSFLEWLEAFEGGEHTSTSTGRRLKSALPDAPLQAVRALCAALRPLSDTFPAPYYRLGR